MKPLLVCTLTSSVVVVVIVIFVIHNLLDIPAVDLVVASTRLRQRLLVATLLGGLAIDFIVTFLATCNVKKGLLSNARHEPCRRTIAS